ncbi:hypothetical protein Q4489_01325 [Thalassotalea sp. 1_MG-2023]|uniref:hypothetical protein n=1 Tax=Thalassotalea sp. 1_MG-2023 TaxID=3062680 RepID=UPI0026E38B4F|nr:hypothetical protein [Thalassotalea sp. 1_MG-2023]MDO6425632.1 hypothetical protein [Thalassotalea sp. 1_MG-2023]
MKAISIIFFLMLLLPLTAKEFTVGVQNTSFYPLYDFPNPSHTKDLLDAFAKSKGYTFTYIALPVKRTNFWYKENAIDFKYPDNRRWTSGRSYYPLLKFSLPTVELLAAAIVPVEKLGRKREEIKQLGTIFGFHPTLWLDLIEKGNTEVVESPSTLNIVKQAAHGYVDALNIEPAVVKHHLRLLNKEGALVIDESLPHEVYSYHLSTIHYPEVLKEFDQFLLNNQALLEKLKKKYHIDDISAYKKNEQNK